jgi:predicted nucleic acid-binding protein
MTSWLIDKSALVRLGVSPDAAQWADRIERGLVRIATVTRLEVGYSARSGPELRAGLRRPPLTSMPAEYLTPAIEDRAVEVLALLADRRPISARPDHRRDRGTRFSYRSSPRQGLRDHR